MGSEGVKLPVIDFSVEDLKPGTLTWNSIKVEVINALQEFGCFLVLYDKIPTGIQKALFQSSKELFDLPFQTKAKYCRSTIYQGYVCNPGHESFNVDELQFPETVESFTDMMWPQGNSKFRETIQFHFDELSELDRKIRKMVLESLGLEKYMDEHMDSTNLIQFNKYFGPRNSDNSVALRVHTDKGLLGILTQNETKGLQIQTKDGRWIEIDYPPNSFFVLPGDVFHAWTNGRLHNPVHRVLMTGNDTRYSVGFFSNTNPGYMVKAPKEIVDAQNPLLYKPFNQFGFLAFYFTKAGQSSDFPLKKFCGV